MELKKKMAKRAKMKYPIKLGTVLCNDMSSTPLSERLQELEIWRLWSEVVGETVACHATPLRIIKGVLTLAVSSGPWMQELRYMTKIIQKKLNHAIGANIVTSIVLKSGASIKNESEKLPTVPRKKRLTPRQISYINEQSAALPDPELQQIFAELMKASYQNPPNSL